MRYVYLAFGVDAGLLGVFSNKKKASDVAMTYAKDYNAEIVITATDYFTYYEKSNSGMEVARIEKEPLL